MVMPLDETQHEITSVTASRRHVRRGRRQWRPLLTERRSRWPPRRGTYVPTSTTTTTTTTTPLPSDIERSVSAAIARHRGAHRVPLARGLPAVYDLKGSPAVVAVVTGAPAGGRVWDTHERAVVAPHGRDGW